MSPHDFAEVLFRKALQDLFTVEKLLPDPESPEEVIGFHAQQAVEKFMKAVLASRGTVYRPTHNLLELTELLERDGTALPADHPDFPSLGPYAAVLRYDELELEDRGSFNREWALTCIQRTREWAARLLGNSGTT